MRTNHISDSQEISKKNCNTKDCPSKAEGIFKKKFLCKECSSRINPKASDRRVFSIRGLFKHYKHPTKFTNR